MQDNRKKRNGKIIFRKKYLHNSKILYTLHSNNRNKQSSFKDKIVVVGSGYGNMDVGEYNPIKGNEDSFKKV
jgi:hypothetical protein